MERTGRRSRSNKTNSIHHVMMRGNNRQQIFHGDEYFNFFLAILAESADKFDHKILAYCIMSNHIHLIVKAHLDPLSAVMQNINFRYARWVNHKRRCIGHLFQGRYHSLEVEDEEYLINLCRYIHRNPIAANMVKHLEEYRWSSHSYYILESRPRWFDANPVTQAIKNKTGLNYNDFMIQNLDQENWKPSLRRLESGEFVIDDSLFKAAQEAFSSTAMTVKNPFLSVEDVVNVVCSNLKIYPNELFGPRRSHDVSKKRLLLVSKLLKHSSINITQVADLFSRNPATLSRQVKRVASSFESLFEKEILRTIEDEITSKLKIVNDPG
jgi:putative transposase